jgi:hypothetical protein
MARHKIVVEWGDILMGQYFDGANILMRRILDVGGLVHLVRYSVLVA